MMHEHLVYPTDRTAEADRMYPSHAITFPRLYLAAGVTTMRTAGTAEPMTDLNLKYQIESGASVGPDIDVTSSWMDAAPPLILQETPVRDAADARRQVQFWSAEGITSFKVYMTLTREPMAAVIDEAHKLGHKVAGHLCAVTAREAAEIDIDSLEHGLFAFTDFVPGKKVGECPDQDSYRQGHGEPRHRERTRARPHPHADLRTTSPWIRRSQYSSRTQSTVHRSPRARSRC